MGASEKKKKKKKKVLVPKRKAQKRTNVGQITRGELKRRIPHGDPKYLLGMVV
jgi:hypothetical protein